jgi:hypothetical protein
MVDLEMLIEHSIERERPAVALGSERIGCVAVGRDESRAVDLDLTVFADETEFHGEPASAATRAAKFTCHLKKSFWSRTSSQV